MKRPPFVYWACLWGLGAAIPVVSSAEDCLTHYVSRILGRDFSNAWTGGRLALDGQSWCAFDVDCFRAALMEKLDVVSLQNFSYPPHTLFLDSLFAVLPYYAALAAWTVFGTVLFYRCARPWLPNGFAPVLAVATPAALFNIWNGHYGFVFGALWLLFFRDLDDRPRRAGAWAALLTFKPHLGLLIAVAAVTKRKVFVVAIAGTLVLFAISAAVFGLGSWADFIASTSAAQTDILTRTTGDFYFRMMPSAYVAFGHGTRGVIGQFLFAVAAAAILARCRRANVWTFATATFLILPYSFNYDMPVACLGFAVLLWSRWQALTFLQRGILSLAFLSPELTYFAAWAAPPTLLAALYIQASAVDYLPTTSRDRGSDVEEACFVRRPGRWRRETLLD